MQKWPTAEHFASWLNLSPRPKISGGKIIGYEQRNSNNPATQAFRLASARCVWDALRTIAQLAGRERGPKSLRAIAQACAENLIILTIPCHRVTGNSERWRPIAGVSNASRPLSTEKPLPPDVTTLLVESPSLHPEFRFTDNNRSAAAAVQIYFENVR